MKAISIKALPEYKIAISFDDGVNGVIDLAELVEQGIFKKLQEGEIFFNVYLTECSIAWSDELEIDVLNIYAELLNKDPEDFLKSDYCYASN